MVKRVGEYPSSLALTWRSGKSRIRGDPEHLVRFAIAPIYFHLRLIFRCKYDTSAGLCGTLVAY